MRGKPFGKDEKPRVSKGRISFTLQSSLLCENQNSLYSNDVLPKESLFLFTSLSYPNFLLLFLFSLSPWPNCSITCSSYSTGNVVRYIKIDVKPLFTHFLIQLLYYTMARGERKLANVRVMERKVALLLHGEQAIDKEKNIREARSDARVLNSGPTQNQSIRSALQHLTIRGCYLPFMQVFGVHVRCKSYFSSRWSCRWHEPKILFFSQHFPSFPHSQPTCRVQIQPRQRSHMPWLV